MDSDDRVYVGQMLRDLIEREFIPSGNPLSGNSIDELLLAKEVENILIIYGK